MKRRKSRNASLTERAFKELKNLLFSGTVRAGQLISTVEIMAHTGMPLAPIRDAIKYAEAAGLVSILPKRGILVIEATPETVYSCFHLRSIFDQEGVRVLSETDSSFILGPLREAHVRVRDNALAGITPELREEAIQVDWRLHQTLAESIGNDLALKTYNRNRDRIAVLQQSRQLLPERIVPAMEEHLRIIDTIMAGQAEQAMQAVRKHLRSTLHWWGVM